MIVLVDSGILIRYFQPSDPAYNGIHSHILTIQSRGDELAVSLQNTAEFWNVCTRPKTSRGGLGLTILETQRRLLILESRLPILDEHLNTYAVWRGLVLRHRVCGKQVHDARLAALMLAHGISHILTLNGADFARYPGIVIVDPQVP